MIFLVANSFVLCRRFKAWCRLSGFNPNRDQKGLLYIYAGADLGGGCRGCTNPPPPPPHSFPEMTCSFLTQLVFFQKKSVWFIGVEVKYETALIKEFKLKAVKMVVKMVVPVVHPLLRNWKRSISVWNICTDHYMNVFCCCCCCCYLNFWA